MSSLFTTIFLQPILNFLVFLYNIIPGHDFGIAIILLTLVVKLLLYPLTVKQIRQQKAMQELQPKIAEIQAKYADRKEEQARELMALYAREKVNPASSCWPLLLQLPIFIGLYRSLTYAIGSTSLSLLYPFVANPQRIDTHFLGLLDLSHPNYVLAIAAALVQFVQTRQIIKPPAATITAPPPEVAESKGAKDETMAAMMNKQMMYMMPIMTAAIGFTLPGGLTLYWLVMSLLTVAQQWWLFKHAPPRMTPQLSGTDTTSPS